MTQIILFPSPKNTPTSVSATAGFHVAGDIQLQQSLDDIRAELVGTVNFLEALFARLCTDGQRSPIPVADSRVEFDPERKVLLLSNSV